MVIIRGANTVAHRWEDAVQAIRTWYHVQQYVVALFPQVDTILFNPFSTAVPNCGQTTLIPSVLCPKRDCSTKRVETRSLEKEGGDVDIRPSPRLQQQIVQPHYSWYSLHGSSRSPEVKDVRSQETVSQGKTCIGQGCKFEGSTLKSSSLASVKENKRENAVRQGVS